MIALALALEIGANAPDELKPCPLPHIERQAGHGLYTHIRRLKTTCEPVGPLSSFAERSEPVEFSPVPDVPETIAAAPNTTPVEQEVVTDGQEPYGFSAPVAAAFISGTIYTPVVYTPIPAAPEPETWLLMVAGLAFVWRRRHGR